MHQHTNNNKNKNFFKGGQAPKESHPRLATGLHEHVCVHTNAPFPSTSDLGSPHSKSTFSLDPAHLGSMQHHHWKSTRLLLYFGIRGAAKHDAPCLSSQIWDVEAGGSGIQSHHQLHRQFKGGMSYMNPCLKIRGG